MASHLTQNKSQSLYNSNALQRSVSNPLPLLSDLVSFYILSQLIPVTLASILYPQTCETSWGGNKSKTNCSFLLRMPFTYMSICITYLSPFSSFYLNISFSIKAFYDYQAGTATSHKSYLTLFLALFFYSALTTNIPHVTYLSCLLSVPHRNGSSLRARILPVLFTDESPMPRGEPST